MSKYFCNRAAERARPHRTLTGRRPLHACIPAHAAALMPMPQGWTLAPQVLAARCAQRPGVADAQEEVGLWVPDPIDRPVLLLPAPFPAQPAWPCPRPPLPYTSPALGTRVAACSLAGARRPGKTDLSLLARPDPGARPSPQQEASQQRPENCQSTDSHVTVTLASSYFLSCGSSTVKSRPG